MSMASLLRWSPLDSIFSNGPVSDGHYPDKKSLNLKTKGSGYSMYFLKCFVEGFLSQKGTDSIKTNIVDYVSRKSLEVPCQGLLRCTDSKK